MVKTVDTTRNYGTLSRLANNTVVDYDSDGRVSVGDRIFYNFTVYNTGTTTVSNITLTDADADWVTTTSIASLPGGGSYQFIGAGAYIILTQEDIDAGLVSNTATATGDSPNGTDNVTDTSGTDPDADTDDQTETLLPADPELRLVKTGTLVDVNNDGRASLGDRIDYAFTIRNTGNVTVTNIVVTDAKVTMSGGPVDLAPGAVDSSSFMASYTITQDDLDAGSVVNTALATGQDPDGDDVTDTSGTDPDADTDDQTETLLPAEPSIAIAKSVTSNGDIDAPLVGDELTYEIVVTNDGNVTLHDVAVTDDFRRADDTVIAVTLSAPSFSAGDATAFAPGATATYSYTHVITQDDVDAGGLVNTATATAKDPDNGPVEDTLTDAEKPRTPIATNPAIALIKTGLVQDVDNVLGTSLGDKVTYSFHVKNTGNVTLRNVRIDDPRLGGMLTPRIAALAPGEEDEVSFTTDYALSNADLELGSVSNQATVYGDHAGGSASDLSGPAFDSDEVTVTFLGSIAGTVIEGDQPMGNVTVQLLDENGRVLMETETGQDGTYAFLELDVGIYKVRFIAPSGKSLLSSSAAGDPLGNEVANIEVQSGPNRSVSSVNALLVDPSGVVYDAITRLPVQGATVTLKWNGQKVSDAWLDTVAGDANDKVTAADGGYSFFLKSPAQTGRYTIEVSHPAYAFESAILPPQQSAKTTALGFGVEEIVASIAAPADGADATYYTAFNFTFGDWTDPASLSKVE